jgi:hypothetical protein
VYLKVSPMRGLRRFNVRGKLAPRFIGPFKILENRGEVAYQLELSSQLSDVHDVFHVSQLNKCLQVPEEQLSMEDLDAKEDLIKSILSRFWKHQRGLRETRRSRCARCSGVTIPRKKLHGKGKKSRRQSFQISFLIHLNLGDEIRFKG